MKTRALLHALAALALFSGVACNCATHESASHEATGESARVTGTVVDAASGEALSGIKITGPHGTHCVSGEGGRFELGGLHTGDSGEISASASDGRVATLSLRPLRPGDLEVVLRLARR